MSLATGLDYLQPHTSQRVIRVEEKVVIVGAGCFGLSTAFHLLLRGFRDVTVLERSEILPAPDAASCDMNKIVRSSYGDIAYSRLARDAIKRWRDKTVWGDTYHESGVLVVGFDESEYASAAYINDMAVGARTVNLAIPGAVKKFFPDIPLGFTSSVTGYINYDGGWVESSEAIKKLGHHVESFGGKIVLGKAVAGLTKNETGVTNGVTCEDGTHYDADIVVLASGSWTASTFPELDLNDFCLATGQSTVTIQLTPEEGNKYRNCPVYLDLNTGFYIFPPNHDNIVKLAIHSEGYTQYKHPRGDTSLRPISTPRTKVTDGEDGLRIPKAMTSLLRKGLTSVYPELAQKPFTSFRLCWYTNSGDDNWVIGTHPSDSGVFLATSGSGHAFKFLPTIGTIVVDAMTGKLSQEDLKKFAPYRHDILDEEKKKHRVFKPIQKPPELNLDELCMPEDLLP